VKKDTNLKIVSSGVSQNSRNYFAYQNSYLGGT